MTEEYNDEPIYPSNYEPTIMSNLLYRPHIKTTCLEGPFFIVPPSYSFHVTEPAYKRPPVRKDHIMLVPRVVFIYKFHCNAMYAQKCVPILHSLNDSLS